MQEVGISNYLKKRAYKDVHAEQHGLEVITLNHVYPAFVLYCTFVIVAVVILCFELVVFALQRKCGKNNTRLSCCRGKESIDLKEVWVYRRRLKAGYLNKETYFQEDNLN